MREINKNYKKNVTKKRKNYHDNLIRPKNHYELLKSPNTKNNNKNTSKIDKL